VLLSSPTFGLAAACNNVGQGSVLFVNLPLGFLKQSTDGVWLHGFLHYFAADLLHLPVLSPVPQGVGGLVFNWHLCYGGYKEPLLALRQAGVFKQGPFSIHITAGPDMADFGDGLGWDLPHNPFMRDLLRKFANDGHQVASHGGWLHDYFGLNVNESNQALFEPFLLMNKNAVEAATGRPMLEYSAPVGNQPEWITTWMEQRGVLAYYFTGNAGMGMTRSYRNGRLRNPSIWSIPVSNYGSSTSFEDFTENGIGHAEAATWLTAMANFGAMNRVARMIYEHPQGAYDYADALLTLLVRAAAFQRLGSFRWYTMAGLARFMNQREKTTWNVSQGTDGALTITATHPETLKDVTWVLPKAYYSMPIIQKGLGAVRQDRGHRKPAHKKKAVAAAVREDEDEWVVIATDCQQLQFVTRPVVPAAP
jgi:hypothetical protein